MWPWIVVGAVLIWGFIDKERRAGMWEGAKRGAKQAYDDDREARAHADDDDDNKR